MAYRAEIGRDGKPTGWWLVKLKTKDMRKPFKGRYATKKEAKAMHAFVRIFGTADADEANSRMIERQRREHIEALRRTGVRVQIIQEKD
jgi:hypothetical protein